MKTRACGKAWPAVCVSRQETSFLSLDTSSYSLPFNSLNYNFCTNNFYSFLQYCSCNLFLVKLGMKEYNIMRKFFFSGPEFLSFFLQKMDGTLENYFTEYINNLNLSTVKICWLKTHLINNA